MRKNLIYCLFYDNNSDITLGNEIITTIDYSLLNINIF